MDVVPPPSQSLPLWGNISNEHISMFQRSVCSEQENVSRPVRRRSPPCGIFFVWLRTALCSADVIEKWLPVILGFNLDQVALCVEHKCSVSGSSFPFDLPLFRGFLSYHILFVQSRLIYMYMCVYIHTHTCVFYFFTHTQKKTLNVSNFFKCKHWLRNLFWCSLVKSSNGLSRTKYPFVCMCFNQIKYLNIN